MEILGIVFSTGELYILGLIGACLAWIVPHQLAIARERQSRFTNASSEFRKVFTEFIHKIELDSDPRGIQKRIVEKRLLHRQTANDFERTLNRRDRRRFAKAWRDYETECNQHVGRLYELKQAIHALLRFTA